MPAPAWRIGAGPSVVDSHAPRTMNRAGWRRPTKETASLNEPDHVFEYLVYPAVFRQELCNGFDPRSSTNGAFWCAQKTA
jgi:hypothetical protein